jgi:hypothetical protein
MSKTPSIAVIPSGYKASKVYSVLPTNGDADLDFIRNCEARRVNQNGLIETVGLNVPRLDYSDGGCPSLLLEPQRTNSIKESSDFTPSWAFGRSTRSVVNQQSPSGEMGIVLASAEASSSTATHRVYSNGASALSGESYSASLYVKQGTSSKIELAIRNSSESTIGIDSCVFDFDSETILNGTFEKLQNGWFRISVSGEVDQDSDLAIFIYIYNQEGEKVFIADGSENTFIWGAQLEEGSFTTSYIPTEDSTVTRFKDQASKDNLESYINSSDGVLYAEINIGNISDAFRYLSISDNTTSNRVRLYVEPNTSVIYGEINGTISTGYNIGTTSYNKVAVKWKQNEFKLFVNGVLKASNTTSLALPINMNRITYSSGNGTSLPLFGKTKDLRVYNEALTDAELITLTQ